MSNLARDMASPKALREWCRVTCAPDVEIRNMSTSFRDGLAFCAIISKHRPDLIDFSSLSKDDAYQNNKLAFEIAETKLGIPALLDPKDMVSTRVPDSLSIITYLSQYYNFFNRKSYAGLASLRSSHVTVLTNLTKSKAPDGLKTRKVRTDLDTGREDSLSSSGQQTVCSLCFKPVHLIQRHLIDGKVYHRSCFRCKVCQRILLPGSYTQGSDAGSLICTHHVTDRNHQTGSTDNRHQCTPQILGYFSLGGQAITTVPHYTKNTVSQDGLVCKTAETQRAERQDRSGENRDNVTKEPAPPQLPHPPSEADRAVDGAIKPGPAPVLVDRNTKTQEPAALSSPRAQVTEGSSRPVPAPRRLTSVVPVPAPRTKTSQTMNSPHAAGNSPAQNKTSPSSPHLTSPTSSSSKVQTNHPWLGIVHPGPWTQLPPAPAPIPAPRSKSVSNLRRSWYRPRVPGPNPFAEDLDEDTQEEGTNPEPADQTKPSVADIGPGGVTDGGEALSESTQLSIPDVDEAVNTGLTEAAAAEAGRHTTSDDAHILPRSLSVPAITSDCSKMSLLPVNMTETDEGDQVTSCQSKLVCKENPFDRKPAMSKSKTFQDLPSKRTPAPGHGFPLIKRKVQTDQNVSTEDLQVEMKDLDKRLEAMEQKGVELERKLRDCKNDKAEEEMLMEWFSLVQERNILVRRDIELVYLSKQQKLEERQADVEYELRCLLNKPESDWSQEDRDQEKQLMDELVTIIEQRNQIISSLDQDRQREREEDMLLVATMKNKESQKEELKEIKKSKGKFKTSRVFKMLNQKAESSK